MNTSPKILTIIICTYNRNEILDFCVDSLVNQSSPPKVFQVLIVNNYKDHINSEKIKAMITEHQNFSIIMEPRPGLSIARNTGARKSRTPWVAYIDDDCIVPENFVEEALKVIRSGKYECFGGPITPWWLYPRPKWLSESYGIKPFLSNKVSILKEKFNWGGNIFFQTECLLTLGGFDEDVGMKKNKIGYSAENRVQMKFRERKYAIGYAPAVTVQHLVARHKMKLIWHIKAAYAEGRDAKPVFPEQYTAKAILKDFFRQPRSFAQFMYKWITREDYYWENMALDIFKSLFRLVGKIKSFL